MPHKSTIELNISAILLFLHCLFLMQEEYSLLKFKAKAVKASPSLQQPEPSAGIKVLWKQVLEYSSSLELAVLCSPYY